TQATGRPRTSRKAGPPSGTRPSPVEERGSRLVARASWPEPSCLGLLDFLGGLRRDLEQVADDAEVRNLEDRGLLILVDGDDGLRRLHAGLVLDGAGNAQ